MKANSLLYHDIVESGRFGETGFLGEPARRYKIESNEFLGHLSALHRSLDSGPVRVLELLESPSVDGPVMLTFDDGGLSAYTHVVDALARYGWIAHFFVVTDRIGDPGFLNAEQIRSIRKMGHIVGSHSSTHPERMSHLGWELVRREWEKSVKTLSDILGEEVTTASVPHGYYSRTVALAAAVSGIRALFTSEPVKTSHAISGCRVFGRYVIRPGTSAEHVVELMQNKYWPGAKRYVAWNIRKIGKGIGGATYLTLRSYFLAHFPDDGRFPFHPRGVWELVKKRMVRRSELCLDGSRRDATDPIALEHRAIDRNIGVALRNLTNKRMTLRVLMVLAPAVDTDQPPIWAIRQMESLRRLGVAVEQFAFRNRRSVVGLVRGGLALRRMVRLCEPDLVHVHYGAAQALVAVLFSPKPVVVSFCGSDLLGNYDEKGRKTWSGLFSGVLSKLGAIACRRSIAKSEELRQSLWLSLSRSRCDVIPNGVDLEAFRPMPQDEAREALGWSHRDPVVLFMDRKGDWVKNPSLAYEAYAEAKKSSQSVRLYIIEHEPPENMPLLFNAADVLLVTSRHEGSNNTTKEAMACNCPVVSTACGDSHDRLRGVHNCFVCGPDPRELGLRLTQIATARERSNGRQLIQELSLELIGMRILRCYEKALTKSARRSPSPTYTEMG